jgi:Uma2 family endonuclease
MSGRPHAPSLTEEDYYNLPDNGMRYQLIEGELYMAPAPNLYHQTISGNLEFIFRAYLEQNPLGILLHAPFDVVFHGESIWQPDIFVVLNAKSSTVIGCTGKRFQDVMRRTATSGGTLAPLDRVACT